MIAATEALRRATSLGAGMPRGVRVWAWATVYLEVQHHAGGDGVGSMCSPIAKRASGSSCRIVRGLPGPEPDFARFAHQRPFWRSRRATFESVCAERPVCAASSIRLIPAGARRMSLEHQRLVVAAERREVGALHRRSRARNPASDSGGRPVRRSTSSETLELPRGDRGVGAHPGVDLPVGGVPPSALPTRAARSASGLRPLAAEVAAESDTAAPVATDLPRRRAPGRPGACRCDPRSRSRTGSLVTPLTRAAHSASAGFVALSFVAAIVAATSLPATSSSPPRTSRRRT